MKQWSVISGQWLEDEGCEWDNNAGRFALPFCAFRRKAGS
jgi:hypothetical protein